MLCLGKWCWNMEFGGFPIVQLKCDWGMWCIEVVDCKLVVVWLM